MALKRRAAATHQQGDSARAEVAADGVLEDPRPRLLARIFVHLSLPLSLSQSWLFASLVGFSCFRSVLLRGWWVTGSHKSIKKSVSARTSEMIFAGKGPRRVAPYKVEQTNGCKTWSVQCVSFSAEGIRPQNLTPKNSEVAVGPTIFGVFRSWPLELAEKQTLPTKLARASDPAT